MDWKVVFFDLDGTLVNKDFILPQSVIDGVQAIRQLGYRVSVATGRSQESAKKFLKSLEIDEKAVVHNGAVVIDKNFNYQVIGTLDPKIIQQVIDLHSQSPLSFKIHFPDSRIIKSTNKPWQGEGEHFAEGEVIENLQNVDLQDAVKIVFFEEQEKIKPLRNSLEKKMNIKFLRTHLNHIEILPHTVNKAKGIKKILETESFGMAQVIGVGDNENDLEMIQQVGMGISIGNEYQPLKKISKYHFDSLSDEGIKEFVQFLKKLK